MTSREAALNGVPLERFEDHWVRAGTSDSLIVKEAAYREGKHGYLTHLEARPGDVWFDIGGHIGGFSTRIAPVVRQVIAFEPFPDNAALFRMNVEALGVEDKVTLIESAVVPGRYRKKTVPLRPSPMTGKVPNTGSHSILDISGRNEIEVRAARLSVLLTHYLPNMVKLDAEGVELYLLEDLLDYGGLDGLVMEWHFMRKVYREEYPAVLERLREHFDHVSAPPEAGKLWHTIIHAWNDR